MTAPEKLGVLNQSLLGQLLVEELVDFRVKALSQLTQEREEIIRNQCRKRGARCLTPIIKRHKVVLL